MITNCGGDSYQFYGLDDAFLFGVGLLMIAVVPVAIACSLWKIFVTNRIGPRRTILGLDENSANTEVDDHGISGGTLFLYGLTGFVFAFEAFRYVVDLLFA